MDNIFSVPDLLEDPFADSFSPFKFNDIDSFNELDSFKFGFDDQNEKDIPGEFKIERYDKHSDNFSGFEKGLGEDFNLNQPSKEANCEVASPTDTKNDNEGNKSSALSKIALLGQGSMATNVEHSSITSQISYEGTQKDCGRKTNDSSSLGKAGEIDSIDSVGVYNSKEKDSSENLDEGSLVFLIRKIDRKTKKSKLLTKHRKKITKCPHKNLEYYAKGMCKNCYHNKGKRSKKASKCEHKERDHYAKGLCKNCYLHFFHIKKKERKASELSKAQTSI